MVKVRIATGLAASPAIRFICNFVNELRHLVSRGRLLWAWHLRHIRPKKHQQWLISSSP